MKTSTHKVPIHGEKIVTASNMAAYERFLIDNDQSLAEKFMDQASLALVEILTNKVLNIYQPKEVILLVGKGNNGGDAYAVGTLLLKNGYKVIAYELFAKLSELAAKKARAFEKASGIRKLIDNIDDLNLTNNQLIIDGLLGTGFRGEIPCFMASVIEKCNAYESFVFSIDIPSGVNGDSGEVSSTAIYADMTGYLGALKTGHLFEQGFEHVGELHYVDFGMDISHLYAEYYLVNPSILANNLPRRSRLANKYSVGQVCVISGYEEMVGAGELACLAAYRSGCGIVKQFHLGEKGCSIKEVISSKISEENIDKELYRTKSILIGPGLGKKAEAKQVVDKLFRIENIPFVIDADALDLMDKPPKNAILTPHKGELLKLLQIDKNSSEKEILEKAQSYVNSYSVYIVYKGVPTVILSPYKKNIVLVSGNCGMATGGSGDVLSGIIASFLAQGSEPIDAALLGVTVHGKAGDVAAKHLSYRFMMASDIIEGLSAVFLKYS